MDISTIIHAMECQKPWRRYILLFDIAIRSIGNEIRNISLLEKRELIELVKTTGEENFFDI